MTVRFVQDSPGVLARQPEARAFKMDNLLAEVALGRVRVPGFQRGLKWDREDGASLIDSIYRGYPIGTLLLWETDAPAAELKFGSVAISAPARSDALWIVDGQQRIVSLSRILLAPSSTDDAFALYFDLDESVFEPPPSRLLADSARWLPLTEALDSERLIQWILRNQVEDPQRRERAIQLGKRIREYDVPAYIVRTNSEEVLREVFGRINSSGKRLNEHEVFDALHGARSISRPATIDQIADQLDALEFGRVENKILYRLLRVLQGVDIIERSGRGSLRLSPAEAAEAYRQTADAAASVIQFLKHDVGIPHYALLPYKQPFVTLGKFFSLHRSPNPRSRDLLVRWLWRGALDGSHKGDTVSTRRVLALIDPGSEEGSVQRMLETVGRKAPLPLASDTFNFRFAVSKLEVLALLDLRPRDLATGDLLEPGRWSGGGGRELPLPALLDGGASDERLQSVANRIVHDSRPGLRKALLAVEDPQILGSHGISSVAIDALERGDRESFLRHRAETLQSLMNVFFCRRARFDEDDRPSLASLVLDDVEER